MSTEPAQLPPIVRECTALRDLADWAETLLCNARPPPHCTQEEWTTTVADWRDRKSGLRLKSTEEIVRERETQIPDDAAR